MKLQHSSPRVKRTIAIFVCSYDYDYGDERYLFMEKHSDGTWQESEYDYPSEEWCRMMIEDLQADGCASGALIYPGWKHCPRNWKDRKFQRSYDERGRLRSFQAN